MSIFEGKYRNDETGRAAYDPKILLKVLLRPIPGGWFLLGRSNKPAGRM
jgi:hypothetical protein